MKIFERGLRSKCEAAGARSDVGEDEMSAYETEMRVVWKRHLRFDIPWPDDRTLTTVKADCEDEISVPMSLETL